MFSFLDGVLFVAVVGALGAVACLWLVCRAGRLPVAKPVLVEWNPGDYARHSSLQEAMAAEQLSGLVLRGDERILDVGCGDGRVTAKIAARVPRGVVLGVDPSHNMIAFAAAHFGPAVQANVRFEVADARTLSYRDEFDLIVSFNALHWVHEQDAVLRGLRTALKPGGRTMLRFVPRGPCPALEDVIEECRHEPRWAGYFGDYPRPNAPFTPEEYQALAEQAGLRVQRIERYDLAWDFRTREAFAGFCRATFIAWVRFVPDALKQAFLNDVLDRYRVVVPEENVFKFYQMEVVLERAR